MPVGPGATLLGVRYCSIAATLNKRTARTETELQPRSNTSLRTLDWDGSMAALQKEYFGLRSAGRWTSGPPELLAILGVHHDEVRNCRAVRWLLDPEAPHGLGTRMLRRLYSRLGLDEGDDAFAAATVRTEITRDLTRADIVIQSGVGLVVIEAKTFAPEGQLGAGQCAELERAWGDEGVTYVFLSRKRQAPATTSSAERWWQLTWSDVADDLSVELVATEGSGAAGRPAAVEYLRSLRRYL